MKMRADFADWLSPMLVKELRQGMRSRLFVISFLLLQGAMILVAILGLAASANQQDTGAMTGLFWTIIVVPLMLIMPMSGLNAVGNEKKANTLELIFLTRLTARRIIAGKWFAIVAQTVLLVCAVLPYAMLRYFLGSVNIASEVTAIAMLLFGSALLSGAAVGLSPQSSRVTRVLLGLGIFVGFQIIVPLFAFAFRATGFSVLGGPKLEGITLVGFALLSLIALLLMLEFGASKIAPPAENHTTPRRLLGLAALAVAGIFAALHLIASPILLCALILLAPICIGALCEPPRMIASIYRPFVKFGFLGKSVGRILYPGWPSGVFFTVLLVLILLPVAFKQGRGAFAQIWIAWIGVTVAGALFLPAALIHTSMPRFRRPGVMYVLIQFACAFIAAMAALSDGFKMGDMRPIAAVIPMCGLLLVNSGALTDNNIVQILLGTSVVTAASIGLLLIKMRGPWREIRLLEKVAAALPPAPSLHAPAPRTAE
jgi:hypothetical protein